MIDWQESFIRGARAIEVNGSLFGYELVMQASSDTMTTSSRVKVYPIFLKLPDSFRRFTQMSVSNSCYHIIENRVIVLPYMRGHIMGIKSLTLEELNDRELQLSRHLCVLERQIYESYLPKILAEFERQNAVSCIPTP